MFRNQIIKYIFSNGLFVQIVTAVDCLNECSGQDGHSAATVAEVDVAERGGEQECVLEVK